MKKQKEGKNTGRTIVKILLCLLLVIVIFWFFFITYEYNRVNADKKPLICFNEVKDVESPEEYSKTCYGLLYKYKEYYYTESNTMSARELTLFFLEFKRDA